MTGGGHMDRPVCAWMLLLLLGLSACSGDPGSGPVEVKWDRDTCERCRMVLSDRLHAAQIRGGPAAERTRVYKFDDIGGAVVWLEQQPWRDDPRTEIWVNDHRDGRWIDAYRAFYLGGQITPMDFGFGAQDEPHAGALDFSAMRAAALDRVQRPAGMAPRGEYAHD